MSLHPGFFRLPLKFHDAIARSARKNNPIGRIVSAEMEIGGMHKDCECTYASARRNRSGLIGCDCDMCRTNIVRVRQRDDDDVFSDDESPSFDTGPTCGRCLASFHKTCMHWGISCVSDGSLPSDGFELNLAPAGGDRWVEEVNAICGELKSRRAWVDASCGLHTHADCRDVTWYDLRRVLLYYALVEPTLYQLMPNSRRENSYCVPCGPTLAHPILTSKGSLHETKINLIRMIYRYNVESWRELPPQERAELVRNGRNNLTDRYGDRIPISDIHVSMRELIVAFPDEFRAGTFGEYWTADDHWGVTPEQRIARQAGRERMRESASKPAKRIKGRKLDPMRFVKKDAARQWQQFKAERYATSRYNSLNVHSWVHRKSLEWRMPPGTTRPERVIGWGQLLAEMINAAVGMGERELLTLHTGGTLTNQKRWDFLKGTLKVSLPFAEDRRARFASRGASEED